MNEKDEEGIPIFDIIRGMDKIKKEKEAQERKFTFVMFLVGSVLLCLTVLALLS